MVHQAVEAGNAEAVSNVFKALRSSPEAVPKVLQWQADDGSTAVHVASRGGGAVHRVLLKLFAGVPNVDLSIQDKNGRTACHGVCARGDAEGLGLLLNASRPCEPLRDLC